VTARRWLDRADRHDVADYAAVARTRTPGLDRVLRGVSRAADFSRVWLVAAGVLALVGGARGRSAAADGLASIAITSAVANAVLKPIARRRRPDAVAGGVASARHGRMPGSTSFPSGHAASAFAFTGGVAASCPAAARPLRVLAGLVAYSRVHTGVHYPGDVLAGALLGGSLARVTARARAALRS
jgi:membrane-associated phospholipid phosphatase